MYCSKCGYQLKGNEKYCPKCGSKVEESKSQIIDGNAGDLKRKKAMCEYRRKSHFLVITVIFACILIGTAGMIVLNQLKEKKEEQYLAFVVNREGKYGYINEKGTEVITCKYDMAYPFSKNGSALVGNKNGKTYTFLGKERDLYDWQIIDSNGQTVAALNRYDVAGCYNYERYESLNKNDYFPVAKIVGKNEYGEDLFQWGYVDGKGDEVIECHYYNGICPEISDVTSIGAGGGVWDENGIAYVQMKQDGRLKVVAINEKGEIVFEAGNSIFVLLEDQENGMSRNVNRYLAARESGTDDEGDPVYEYGYVDQDGNVLIDYQFSRGKQFSSNGLAAVKKGDEWGYINEKGEMVIPFQFADADAFAANDLAYVEFGDPENETYTGKYGYINTNGEIIINLDDGYKGGFFTGDFIEVYGDGDNKSGLIDLEGNEIFPCEYFSVHPLDEAGTIIKLSTFIEAEESGSPLWDFDVWYVNKEGEAVIPGEYDMGSYSLGENEWVLTGRRTGESTNGLEAYQLTYFNKSAEMMLELPSEYIQAGVFQKITLKKLYE